MVTSGEYYTTSLYIIYFSNEEFFEIANNYAIIQCQLDPEKGAKYHNWVTCQSNAVLFNSMKVEILILYIDSDEKKNNVPDMKIDFFQHWL